MAKFIKNEYYEKRLRAKVYELMCIKEPENKQYGRDRLKVGETYICREIMASNWVGIFDVTIENCGIEAPRDCFESIENLQ